MHVPVFIDRAFNAVDPAETEGFFYGVIIGKVCFTSVFFQKNKPYLCLPGVVLCQPASPLLTVSRCISHRTFCMPGLTLINTLHPSSRLTASSHCFWLLRKCAGASFASLTMESSSAFAAWSLPAIFRHRARR